MTVPPNPTIRSLAEAIRDRCRPIPGGTPAEHQAFEHARAILDALDAAEHAWRRTPGSRLNTEPMMGYPPRSEHFRLVPDPAPRARGRSGRITAAAR